MISKPLFASENVKTNYLFLFFIPRNKLLFWGICKSSIRDLYQFNLGTLDF